MNQIRLQCERCLNRLGNFKNIKAHAFNFDTYFVFTAYKLVHGTDPTNDRQTDIIITGMDWIYRATPQ